MKFNKPSSWNPHSKLDLDTWLFECKEYLAFTGERDEERMVRFAGSYLEGSAKQWWKVMVATNQHLSPHDDHWDHFTALLKERFQALNPERAYRAKLRALRVERDNIQQFNTRFLDIMMQVPGMTNGEAVDHYCAALRHSTRMEIEKETVTNPNATVLELMRVAERLYAVDHQSRRPGSFLSRTPSHERGPSPMDLSPLVENDDNEEEYENFELDEVLEEEEIQELGAITCRSKPK